MLNLLFPRSCNGCDAQLLKSEKVLCTSCFHKLPLVCHHRSGNTAMKDIFYGRLRINAATALLQFQKKGTTQEIMHKLKYKGQEEIGRFFGKWLGEELRTVPEYSDVNIIIPVPLHKQKLKKRGYNQVTGFARELANALEVEFCEDVLLKVSKTNSQVFKKRLSRFNLSEEKEQVFTIQNLEKIKDKHILLVDDIVTTGATLEKCALQLLQDTNAKISLAVIAIA